MGFDFFFFPILKIILLKHAGYVKNTKIEKPTAMCQMGKSEKNINK